jgi:hypothetical protein
MPLVCIGTRLGFLGETLWERTARALQQLQPGGPYPRSGTLTVFLLDDGHLTARFDVNVTWRGAVAWIVFDNVPRIKHAPIPVNDGNDIVAVARKILQLGCRNERATDEEAPCWQCRSNQNARICILSNQRVTPVHEE